MKIYGGLILVASLVILIAFLILKWYFNCLYLIAPVHFGIIFVVLGDIKEKLNDLTNSKDRVYKAIDKNFEVLQNQINELKQQ